MSTPRFTSLKTEKRGKEQEQKKKWVKREWRESRKMVGRVGKT